MENTNQLIVVEQLPVIVEQLHSIRDSVLADVADADAMVCTEETVKAVKGKRTELGRQFRELEARRKTVKNQIMAPYEQFEAVYKECVSEIFGPADKRMAAKIADVENGLRAERAEKLVAYFMELRAVAPGLEWLEFERIGLNITLSASMKSLREQVKNFVQKVEDACDAIMGMPDNAEIMVEYKTTLNLPVAINTVHTRHAAQAAERRRTEEAAAARQRQLEAEQNVRNEVRAETILTAPTAVAYAEDMAESQEPTFVPPIEAKAQTAQETVQAEEDTRIYKAPFVVYGTKQMLRDLKQFLNDGGYRYE